MKLSPRPVLLASPTITLRRTVARAGVLSLTLGLGYAAGRLDGASSAWAAGDDTYAELRLFSEVLGHIRDRYVHEVETKTLVENAVRGMVTELDPHSAYMNADEFNAMKEDTTGQYVGVGLSIRVDDNGAIVIREVFDGGPAKDSGLLVGDVITHVEGEAMQGLGSDAVVQRLRGKRGEPVSLRILRVDQGASSELVVNVIRDLIHTPAVVASAPVPGYAHLRLRSFQAGAAEELTAELDRLRVEQGGDLKGVVLDLRDNPGGLLSEARAVANLFLDNGLIVSTRGRDERHSSEMRAAAGAIVYRGPLVLLVNGGSASASEVVAGALQDHKRALIVGTTTYGKGSVQSTFEMPADGGLKITVALYYTPNGRSIQNEGIAPDIVVEAATLAPRDNRPHGEAVHRNTIANPNGEQAQEDPFNLEAVTDAQLAGGLRQLRAIEILSDVRR